MTACQKQNIAGESDDRQIQSTEMKETYFDIDTKINEVISDSAFGNFGRLIFPVNKGYYSGDTLGKLSMTWYNDIDPYETVEIVNNMKEHAEAGDSVFYLQ